MRNVELPRTTLGELISYAKQKGSPSVTLIDGIKAGGVDEIMTVAKRLRLILFGVDDGKDVCDKIAILQNSDVTRRIAWNLKKRCQVMMYDFAKWPKGEHCDRRDDEFRIRLGCNTGQWVHYTGI